MELKLSNISMSYNKKDCALHNLNLTLTEGIYGLLGPNGAGKSTLIHIITDSLLPTEGNITLDGSDIYQMKGEYRRIIGYMPQQQNIYPEMTLSQFLYYMASIKGLSKKEADIQIPELCAKVNLQGQERKRMGAFSGGMKQRALIVQALLGNPRIIILDEPTAGLDPVERIRIRNIIAKLGENKIVILATHVISDLEAVADKLIVLKKGELIAFGSPKELYDSLCCEESLDELYLRFFGDPLAVEDNV